MLEYKLLMSIDEISSKDKTREIEKEVLKGIKLDKLGLIIGILLGVIGLYKIDVVLIAGLNYFGKYVFFGLFHLFIIYLYYLSFKKFKGKFKIIMPIILGIILIILGEVLG